MSKMPSLIGQELQCLKSPTYSISDSWAHTTFSRRFRRNIGPSLLSIGGFSDPWEMQDLLQSYQHLSIFFNSISRKKNFYGNKNLEKNSRYAAVPDFKGAPLKYSNSLKNW